MNSRVGQLDLRLSLPPELRPESWKIAGQIRDGFICEVIERIAERFHAQFGPDAIIEIPLLELTWGGKAQVIDDFDYARKLGDEAAEELLGGLDSHSIDVGNGVPAGYGDIKIYRNEAHKSAVTISTLARQQQRAATLTNLDMLEREWRVVCERGSAKLEEALRYICVMETPDIVVESLSTTLIEAAVSVCPLSGWPKPMRAIAAKRILRAPPGVVETGDTLGQRSPTGVAPKANGTGRVDVESAGDPTHGVEPVVTTAESDTAQQEPNPLAALSASSAATGPITGAAHVPTNLQPDGAETITPDTGASRQSGTALTGKMSPTDARSEEQIAAVPDGLETHYAGLVYALNLIMRIELPEILWCCGIDERTFLFDLCCELAGVDVQTDPVVFSISGIQPDRSNYAPSVVPDWAWIEVVQKTHGRLRRLLPEPGPDRQSSLTGQDIDALARESEKSWQTLVGMIAQLLSVAFLELIRGEDSPLALDAYLSLRGRIAVSNVQTVVRLPMESIDIDVRRAALDVNPGYLKWCQYELRLEFVENSQD